MKTNNWLVAVVMSVACMSNSSFSFQEKANNGVAFTEFFRGSTAEVLAARCKAIEHSDSSMSSQQVVDLSFCSGYIAGLLDSDRLDSGLNKTAHRFCVTDEASSSQLARIVAKYGNDHPEELHFPAAALVGLAMKKAFPCA